MSCPETSRTSTFAADFFKLVTGTTLVQAITVLASPLLTRLYGPETFGFLAPFISITSIFGVVTCMRYDLAIMLPKDYREAANLLGLCILSVIVITGLTVPALYPEATRSSLSSGRLALTLPHPGPTVCLHQRGLPHAELLELTHPALRASPSCPDHQFARYGRHTAGSRVCRVCYGREPLKVSMGEDRD